MEEEKLDGLVEKEILHLQFKSPFKGETVFKVKELLEKRTIRD
jgi:hypothetical protein